jgi:hypothetical protein
MLTPVSDAHAQPVVERSGLAFWDGGGSGVFLHLISMIISRRGTCKTMLMANIVRADR